MLLRLTASLPRVGAVLHLGPAAAGGGRPQRLEATLSGIGFSLAEESEVGLRPWSNSNVMRPACALQRSTHWGPTTTLRHCGMVQLFHVTGSAQPTL